MRLIDADRLIDEFEDTIGNPISRTRLKLQVQNQPTIDAVEVVRCKDCRHCVGNRCRRNASLNDWRIDDDFCSFGERKADV